MREARTCSLPHLLAVNAEVLAEDVRSSLRLVSSTILSEIGSKIPCPSRYAAGSSTLGSLLEGLLTLLLTG